MHGITGSVGDPAHGAVNHPSDVRLVQHLLNEYYKKPLLVEDGRAGPHTVQLIADFQKKELRMGRPDGRVDPNGATFRKLQHPAGPQKDGGAALGGLRTEYEHLFATCEIRKEHLGEVANMAQRIQGNRVRYTMLVLTNPMLDVPWWFVGLLHAMESDLNFHTHLHNGDPLTWRTRQEPPNRPPANPRSHPGLPPGPTNPYTWEESAVDALSMRRTKQPGVWSDWSLAGTLYKVERYNGWGYRQHHPGVLSPYLWSYTNHYTRGKYVRDGKWSSSAVSRQPGAAAILRRLVDMGAVSLRGAGRKDYVTTDPTAKGPHKKGS